MLDMLGEDARAAVGKVKQLQSQGATPDQVQAQMMEAARNGLLPISVAFAAQKALQRKNPPSPPPQGTVMSEMLGQLQDPREQGIAGLENPVMDNAEFAGGGVVAFAPGGTTGIKTYTDPKTGEMYRLDSKGNRVKLTPTEVRRLQMENDQRGLKRGIGSMGILPATAYDMVANPLNVTLGGIETVANAAGVARAGRALGVYDPDTTHVTMPRVGDGGGDPGQRYMEGLIAENAPTDVIPTETTPASKAAAAKAAAAKEAGLAALSPEAISKYSVGIGSGEERSPYAGIRAPKISSAGYDQAIEQAAAQYKPTADAQKSQDTILDEILARRERLGIGKADKAQREKLGKKREELEGERKRSKLEEIGMGFLTEGVAAASRGESTLGSLAGGLGAGLKGAKLSKEKLDAAEDKLDDREAALDQQKEAFLLQGDSEAARRWEINENNLRQDRHTLAGLRVQQAGMRLNLEQFNIGNEFKLKISEVAAAASRSKTEKVADPWLRRATAAYEAGDDKAGDEYLKVAAKITAAGAAGVQTEALRQEGKAAETKLLTNPAGAKASGSSAVDRAVAIVEGG